jgi:hypothetical protein
MRPSRCAPLSVLTRKQILHGLTQQGLIRLVISRLRFLTLEDDAGLDENSRVMTKQRETDFDAACDFSSRLFFTVSKFANEPHPYRVGKRREDPGLHVTGYDVVHTHSVTPIEDLLKKLCS